MTELKRKFGDRVRQCSPWSALEDNHLLLSSVASFSRANEMRLQLGVYSMPICALTHSIYTEGLPLPYSSLLLSAEDHDVVVASSYAGKQTLENFLSLTRDRILGRPGMSTAMIKIPKIVQIPFGTELPPEAELDQTSARRMLKIPKDAFVVLYFGRISEEYKADLDPLLQAAQHLYSHGRNVWLILAGQALDRVYSQHLDRRIVSLGLAERSICIENCPEFLKTSVYAACDVMVSPANSIQETFGLSVLEAMAHSRPVVATEWSGYRELIKDGITGFFVTTMWTIEASDVASVLATVIPPLSTAHYLAQRTIMDVGELIEKLTLLMERPELGVLMGMTGREKIKANYGWPEIAAKFINLWEEQLEISQNASPRSLIPNLGNFSHYAGSAISSNDLVARIPDSKDDDIGVLDQWIFHNVGALVEIRRLMKLISIAPMSIGDLRDGGFDLDCILWLAQKGLRRIVAMPLG